MADTKVTNLSAAAAALGTHEFYANEAGADKKVTGTQLAAFISPAMSDTVAGIAEAAIQSEQETGTDVTRCVTPGRQHFHPSALKCWGKATVAANVPTLQVSYNMTSITDTATGQITWTIANDFSAANWSVTVGVERASTALTVANIRNSATRFGGQAAGTLLQEAWDDTATTHLAADPAAWHFHGAGDI